MKKFFVIIAALLFIFSLVPAQSQTAGFVQCGGFETDTNGNRIIQPLSSPVPDGWQKINDSQMAKLQPACGFCDVFKLIENIINFFLFPVVPLLASFFFAVAGFYLLTSAGNPKGQAQGRSILTAVVVGLIIIYAAWLFIGFMLQAFGVAQWTGLGTWWQIPCAQ